MNPPKKAGRRKKDKIQHWHNPPSHPDFIHTANDILSHLAVDPTWSEELSFIFGPLIAGRLTDSGRKNAGVWAAVFIEKAPSNVLEELFRRLLKMKRNFEASEQGEHERNATALLAWKDFVAENGFKPSKRKLKAFMAKQPKIYKNLPPVHDTRGWDRLWEGAGLDGMDS